MDGFIQEGRTGEWTRSNINKMSKKILFKAFKFEFLIYKTSYYLS